MEAAYDDIAEWYENEFLKQQRPEGSESDQGDFADSIGIDQALVELLGTGSGICLEVGCGTGIYGERVRGLGWTPVGIDISTSMLGYANQRLPVAQSDGGRLPFPDNSLPAVITVMTHTDMPHFDQVVGEIARVLQPGGVFVHIGVHPCFCGTFADRGTPPNVVIQPGYLQSGWTQALGPEQGGVGRDGQVRDKVGACHLTLAELLNLFAAVGFTMDRFFEGSGPTPITLSVRALGPSSAPNDQPT